MLDAIAALTHDLNAWIAVGCIASKMLLEWRAPCVSNSIVATGWSSCVDD